MILFWLLPLIVSVVISKPFWIDEDLGSLDQPGDDENDGFPTFFSNDEWDTTVASNIDKKNPYHRDVYIQAAITSCPKYRDVKLSGLFHHSNYGFDVRCSDKEWTAIESSPEDLKDVWGTVVGPIKYISYSLACKDDWDLYCCNSAPLDEDSKKAPNQRRHYCIPISTLK